MKKIKHAFIAIFVITIGGLATYQSQNQVKMSDIMVANIEALALGEIPQKLDCWERISSSGNVLATHITYCGSCSPILAKSWSSKSICVQ